jgi:protoheme IX farnesyltransferase
MPKIAAMTPETAQPEMATPAVARWQDFFQLLKPRVMSLVVFTGLTGLLAARAPINPDPGARRGAVHRHRRRRLGRAEHVVRRRHRRQMRRTRGRPVPSGKVRGDDAAALGVVLSLFSVMMLGMALNWLAAGLLAFTIVFYAVVYTMWLKRWTARTSSSAAWPAPCRPPSAGPRPRARRR